MSHILSIKDALDICDENTDIMNIKDELIEQLIKNNKNTEANKNYRQKSHILLHQYKSTQSINIHVLKNNLKNSLLSFIYVNKNETWVLVKNDKGAHVILKFNYLTWDTKDIEDAASIDAYFSPKSNKKSH